FGSVDRDRAIGRVGRRSMGGGGGHGESTTYKGFTIHHPKRWHVVTGKSLLAIMWFWVLYRAKQDGPVVLGWRHPWEGHVDTLTNMGMKMRYCSPTSSLNHLVFQFYLDVPCLWFSGHPHLMPFTCLT
ncbi:unnamed protein product, partial [Musa acuminata subsp. burmannicoides]